MPAKNLIELIITVPGRWLGSLESLFLGALRLWVGWDFFKSGWLKVTNWDSTLFLFRAEYQVPLLPSSVAAVLGTAGEIAFPVLLWLGLASRLSAVGLFAVNVMAVIAYSHVLLSDGFEAALGQHYLWGMALLVIVVFGPGRLSADCLISSFKPRRAPLSAPAV